MFKKLRSNKPVLLALLIVLLPIVGITGYMVVDPEPESESVTGTGTGTGTGTELVQVVTATETTPEATATAIPPTQTATETPATATTIPPTQVVTETPASPTATQADEASSTIRKIIERGYLIAGVKCNFFPMGHIQDPKKESSKENGMDCDLNIKRDYKSDERAGFEIDIIKEFAKRWLGDESAVEFKTVVGPEDNIDKLTRGEVDLIAAVMTHTKERDERVGFSQTYFDDGQGLLVTDSNIKSLKDLDGKSVAVRPDTTSSKNIETEAEQLGIAITIVPTSDDEGVTALLDNEVHAYTTDSVRLIHLSEQDVRLQFVPVVEGEPSKGPYRFSDEPYGIGVSKGDAEFRDLVNFTLQEMESDGTYKRIYAKWFSDGFIHEIETWPGKSYLNVNLTSMQRIEAGEFTLGTQGSEDNPKRTVELEAYSIDQYEVTRRLYKECMDHGTCKPPENLEQYANLDNDEDKNHPVTWVTFEQAKAYCTYVGKQLPTEDQWEAAARGTDERIYPWRNVEPAKKNANFNRVYTETDTLEVIWSMSPHENHVSPYGVHHMAGNVREWVLSESDEGKVTRGGGWKDTAEDIRTTKRFVNDIPADDVGFRCAVSADEFPSPLP